MKQPVLAAVIFLVAAIFLAGSAPAAPLTLEQCINEAVSHSPELAAVRHDIAAAGYHVTRQRASTLPYLSSQLSAYEINGAPVTPFSILNLSSPENPISRHANAHWDPAAIQAVTATYPIYLYGSIMGLNNPPVVAAAAAELNEQELTAVLAQQKVLLDVSEAFFQAVWYREAEKLDEAIIQLSQEQLDIVSEEVSLGLKIPQTIDLAKAQLDAGQQAAASARQNAANAVSELAALMGRGGDRALELDQTQRRLPPLPSLEIFLDLTMPTHPALRIQQSKVEVARQQYRIDRASILPSVTLNTSFAGGEDLEYINGNSSHRNPTAFLSYLQVEMPLFDFGQRRAAINQSSEEISSAKERIGALELDLHKAVAQNYEQIHDVEAQIALLNRDFVNSNNDVNLFRAQRAEGMISALKLVNAELTLLYVRSSLEYEQYQQRVLYAELQNLSAGAWRWIQ
jgi:outer membrane protein TolC